MSSVNGSAPSSGAEDIVSLWEHKMVCKNQWMPLFLSPGYVGKFYPLNNGITN